MPMAVSHQNQLKTEDPQFSFKEIGNEGLTKRILRKGVTWQTPFSGDEVEVHFKGHVENGASLESSYDKGSAFRFKLGQCEVIQGWDEGVATMKKGERAIFKIPPNLAYGEEGSPPLVPPNATLIYEIEMLSWSTIRDLTGDGRIMKKLIREGEGWATPREDDEVLVKYEARMENGMLVSKSDEGVEFNVSDGYLCPAMSIAVKTMRKGEVAELAVRLFYGQSQNSYMITELDAVLPPDSNLTSIELELVSWKVVTDVTGDKKIMKKIKKVGEGFDRPNEGSQVKVIYLCKGEDDTIIERKGSEEEPFEFTTQEEQVPEGLERAIMTMKKAEQALVTVHAEYLCGYSNSQGKTANNKVLYYEVELVDFVKEKPFWKMDTQEKIEACERKKHDGNLLFKAENFMHASKKYEKALKYIEFDHSFSEDEKHRSNTLRLSCNLNNAACKLKLGEYIEASKLCTKVLEQDPLNIKALYRRCQAYLKTSELEKAEADIKRALTIDPNNRDIKLEYKELKVKQKEYNRYEAGIFTTMVSRMS
ncbi:peptidyl-prolyl cis-trans isomerase FKBP65-like [Vigna unguiculata]|uniref:peptidylprolyl isomerase n=1 Tax=Vigna unguiculata TaxID=3917 RepID=A0A4D6M9N0_VIGUN|nr:peptidyl-prolyl cis-trans isomerase FKBP65-like [Vigna unguiculata]QCD97091.1 F-binding protein 4/5 [Vigna unguiculata]